MRSLLFVALAAMMSPVALFGQFNIVSCEVYFDADPGPGNGVLVSSTSVANLSNALDALDASQLTAGVHRLCLRFKSSSGHWSDAQCRYLYVQPQPGIAQPVFHQIVASEVYFDTDPGPGNAFEVPITSGTIAEAVGSLNTSMLPIGFHRACVRFKSSAGHWSDADCGFMYVQPQPNLNPPSVHQIVAAEFFVDDGDPGAGNATAIDIQAGAPNVQIQAGLNMLGTPVGMHKVHLRFKSSAGNWSVTEVCQFEVVDCSLLSNDVNVSESVCFGYNIGGDSLTASGSYVYTLVNQFGCDSVVNLNLTILPAGCTNPAACNFNPLALCDDGSCSYPGCTNYYACNYDPAAGCDNGSCLQTGCTDPLACENFSATAVCTLPPGYLDSAFVPMAGTDGIVYAVKAQSNGKVVIAGDFTTVNGVARNRIARLNADGSLDLTFDPGSGANGTIYSLAIEANGTILIGGDFTNYNGTGRNRVARILSTGAIDGTFNPGTGADGKVHAIAVQTGGQIVIGGEFQNFNGTPRNRIARLVTGGTLDASFNPGTGTNDAVYALLMQTDGKILVGGRFTTYNGTARSGIARANANGTLDATFTTGTGTTSSSGPQAEVRAIGIESLNKVVIGGIFDAYNGTPAGSIARLLTNGSLDATFNAGVGPTDGQVWALQIDFGDKWIVGGRWSVFSGQPSNGLIRLNTNGSVDTGFYVDGSGVERIVHSMTLRSQGRVVLGGDFDNFNGLARDNVAGILSDLGSCLRDIISPVFLSVPDPIFVSCSDGIPFIPAYAEDNCSGAADVTFFDNYISGACANEYTVERTFVATDVQGNASFATTFISVFDFTPPFFSGFSTVSQVCDNYSGVYVSVFDDCSGVQLFTNDQTLSGGCAGQVLRTYSAIDDCGNFSQFLQTINLVDNLAPALSVAPNVTISCTDPVPPPGYTTSDNCVDPADVNVSINESILPGGCPGNYVIQRNYMASDPCGNITPATQLITVQDNQPPVFTFIPADITIECDQPLPGTMATATDFCSIASVNFNDVTVPGFCPNSYTVIRTFTAVDDCGNSTSAQQVINVIDSTAPILVGDSEITIPESQFGQLQMFPADNCGIATIQLDINFISGGGSLTDYEYTYTAIDECGNASFFVQLVHVFGSVQGCTNPLACNYNPAADEDDGSCILPGCMDAGACNYDPLAGCDSGLCTYPGCTDSAACNFDPLAGCDDGSCLVQTGWLHVPVTAGGEPVSNMAVQVFDFTPTSGQMAQSAGVATTDANGLAAFFPFPEGDYVIRAVPDYQNTDQQLLLTTYHSQTFQWTQGALVHVACGDTAVAPIQMIQLPEPILGPGSASGYVMTHDFNRGDPIPGIPIIIVRDTTSTIAPPEVLNFHFFSMDLTDSDGFYSFNNLPFGHYMTLITIPGLETYPHPLDMADTTAHQFFVVPDLPDQFDWTYLNYYVDEMLGVFLDTCLVGDPDCIDSVFEQAMRRGRWSLQPNPAAESTRLVRWDAPVRTFEIILADVTGRLHRRLVPQGVISEQTLDLRELTPGMYFVMIRDELGAEVLRLIVR